MKKSEALRILGLSSSYSEEDIKQAHRRKIRENHPDRFTDPAKKAEAEEQTKLINEARDVLVNKRWDPEYGPRTGAGYNPYSRPYGNPYSGYGNPYSQYRPGTGGQGNPFDGRDPFEGFPFDYVWTSWDGTRGRQSGQGSPFTGFPFDFVWTSDGATGGSGTGSGNPFDPFASSFSREEAKPAGQLLREKRRSLLLMAVFIVAKLALLAGYVATGAPAVGLAAFAFVSVLFALGRKLVASFGQMPGCAKTMAIWVLVPLVLFFGRVLIALFGGLAALLTKMLPLAIVFAVAGFVYDLSVLRSVFKGYREAKRRAEGAES